MSIPLDAIDPVAQHHNWIHEFEWHFDLLPHVMDAMVTMTLPTIPVSRGGSRFDRDQVTGGGWVDNVPDIFAVTDEGRIVAKGAAEDAQHLWGCIVEYVDAVTEWLREPAETGLNVTIAVNPDPNLARGIALTTAGWLIDRAERIADLHDLDEYRLMLFALLRRLRGRYGVHAHPRQPRATCTVCGARAVIVRWIDDPNGSPKPVRAGQCRVCEQTYHDPEKEKIDA